MGRYILFLENLTIRLVDQRERGSAPRRAYDDLLDELEVDVLYERR
jgi:hypothetical protein